MTHIGNNFITRVCKRLVIEFWTLFKFYLFWILVHFSTTNLYTYLCTPMTIVGFISSPFMAITPHCKVMQWLFTISVNTINQMWVLFGIWMTTKLTCVFQGKT